MSGEFISIETAAKIAALEKENKELKEELFKAKEAAKRIIDLAYQLDELDNKKIDLTDSDNEEVQ